MYMRVVIFAPPPPKCIFSDARNVHVHYLGTPQCTFLICRDLCNRFIVGIGLLSVKDFSSTDSEQLYR